MSIARICVFGVVTVHTVLAVAWWYAMPRGFPAGHAKWWVNEAFPPLILVVGIAATVRWAFFRDWRWMGHIAISLSGAWCGAAVALATVFPTSGLRISPFGAILGLIGIRASFALLADRKTRTAFVSILTGVAVGFSAVALQRAAEPATHPTNAPMPLAAITTSPLKADRTILLSDDVSFVPHDRVVQLRVGGLHVNVEPALQFVSRSPDRFWTLLAPRRSRVSPTPEVVSADFGSAEANLTYAGDFRSSLRVLFRDKVLKSNQHPN